MPEKEVKIENLKDEDQWEIKKGRCPLCHGRLYPLDVIGRDVDQCSTCFAIFTGTLTIGD